MVRMRAVPKAFFVLFCLLSFGLLNEAFIRKLKGMLCLQALLALCLR